MKLIAFLLSIIAIEINYILAVLIVFSLQKYNFLSLGIHLLESEHI